MKPDPRDARLIAAWNEIPEPMQQKICLALKGQHRVGAIVGGNQKVKTSLGYVVHSGFVTPLAAQMIEALDWQASGAAPAKPKRAKRTTGAA